MSKCGIQDTPIATPDDDALGLAAYADALADFARECSTPLTVAVQGEPGSGKTSVMQMVDRQLQADKINTLWFNAWQFGHCDDFELMQSLASHVIDEIGRPDDQALKDAILGRGEEELDPTAEIKLLREKLTDILRAARGEADRLVIFVDDLDRPIWLRTVNFLQALHLLLKQEGCVLVIACRYETMAAELDGFGLEDAEEDVVTFFDRTVQVPFTLPVPDYNVEPLFRAQADQLGLALTDASITAMIELADYSIGFNPRAIKRLFGALALLRRVSERRGILEQGQLPATEEEITRGLWAALCLQDAYEPVYELLCSSELNDALFARLTSVESLMEMPGLEPLREAWEDESDYPAQLLRVALFCQALHRAMQLQLDDDSERLSQGEADTLSAILRFAGLTARLGEPGEALVADRYRNKRMAIQFADELNERYADHLQNLAPPAGFRMSLRRNVAQGAVSVAYLNFVFEQNHQMALTLDFLPTGAAFWATAERRGDRAFIKGLLEETFPDATFPKEAWTYLLQETEFDYGAPWHQRVDEFKELVLQFLDRFLPAIAPKAAAAKG